MSRTYFILILLFLAFPVSSQESLTPMEQHISSLIADIEQNNRTVSELTEESLANLPVGIKKTVGGNRYIIGIDSARVTEKGTYLSAYTEVTLHGKKKKIAFAARNVLFTPSGIDPSPAGRLVMVAPQRIRVSDQVTMTLTGDERNYVEWGCEGFQAVNLKGVLEFSPEIFTPSAKLAPGQSAVQGGFEVNASDLSNILLSVSITPFEVKGLGGMAFEVKQAAWDMSDTANPPGFVFPRDYAQVYGDGIELWQGFFLKETTVYLPSEMGGRTVQVENMLIDDFGLTGDFSVTDVLPLHEGSASGWPFSIDRLSVQLSASRLAGGSMNGAIGIPFLGSDTLGYAARISSGPTGMEYSFSSIFNRQKKYECAMGDLWLHQGCSIQINVAGGRFVPSAILNGALTIHRDLVKIDSIRFEGLHLTAAEPYILGGKFASEAKAGFKLGGFGLSLSNIGIAVGGGAASLDVNARVALMEEKEKGISAETRLHVKAAVEKQPATHPGGHERQGWRYAGLDVDKIILDCKLSLFKLHGAIGLYRGHSVYGDGFEGAIDLAIDRVIPDGLSADIRFGTTPECRYWYAKFNAPIKIPLGYINIESIQGGAYHHMKKKNLLDPASDYLPDAKTGMGFMAGVGLSVIREQLFYGDSEFEIAFTDSWGVRFIQFTGNGQFFAGKPIKKNAPVRAAINMFFDFDNSTFHASMKTYMNLAGTVKGIGPDGLLGEAVVHSDPKDWYIYVGRPSAPFGVELIKIAKAQTYFMAGTKIEDMPLPPSTVRSILGNIDLDFMKKESAIQTGRGMGFGVRFDVGVGIGREKGFVYAFLDLGAGADITLRNYGDAECYGRDGVIGLDGWYASGQAYVYMQGKIGIRVKKSEFDIMSVGMAALLQAKLPNPTWMHGSIAAKYKILGGLIKGKVNVDVTVGEECKIVGNGSELGDIDLIAEIQPSQGGRDVDVFAAPQVAFNTSVDTEFGMMNIYDEYNTYRVKFDDFKLVRPDRSSITGDIRWNQSKDVAILKTRDILPGETELTAEAKVHIEKKSGQTWEALTVKGGGVDYEVKTATFVTGAAPVTIPENNVPYSHPLRNQYNFYRDELGYGYVKLDKGQPDLFYSSRNGSDWKYVARFTTSGGQKVEVPAGYNASATSVNFDLPKGLFNSQVYHMEIVRVQADGGAVDRNAERSESLIALEGAHEGDSLVVAQNRLRGVISAGGEKVLHELDFRTSSFNTFMAKMNSMSGYRELYAVEKSLMSLLAIEGNMNETFDDFELKGRGEEMQPLVYAEALPGNDWLNSHAYGLVYELYGSDPGLTLARDVNVLGLMPLKGMWIFNNSNELYRLDENRKADGAAQARNGYITCRYNIAYYIYQDYVELRDKAAAKYLGKDIPVSQAASRLLSGTLDDMHEGRYAFKINYRLPGAEQPSSEKEYGINYLMN
jgi:hypothetical protein